MRFEERLLVPVSRQVAWDFLWQTQRLAACLPGCKDVQELDAGHTYKLQFEDHIGPYRVHFDMDAEVKETRPPEFIRLYCTGQDKRLGASQRVTLDVSLREEAGQTAIDVLADVEVLGKIATLGQFAVKRKAKDVVRQFAQNISASVTIWQKAIQPVAAGGSTEGS